MCPGVRGAMTAAALASEAMLDNKAAARSSFKKRKVVIPFTLLTKR